MYDSARPELNSSDLLRTVGRSVIEPALPTSSAIQFVMNVTENGIPTLYIYQSVIHSLLILIGCPLNLFIIYTIVSYRRLHKPRSILFLGSCLANFFTLMTILAELVAHHAASTTMCVICVAVTGIANTSLLTNILLSLVDRYVSISFPLWYRNNITVHRVIVTQVLSWIMFPR